MPSVSTPARASRKRSSSSKTSTAKKLQNNGIPRTVVTSTKGPMPKVYKTKLRYCDVMVDAYTTGPPDNTNRYFSCNGMYDPDITGTGHQPLYFDQLMAMYQNYTVIASKCTIIPMSPASSVNGTVYGITLEDDSTGSALPITAIERGGASFGVINNNGGPPRAISKSWKAETSFGLGVMSDPELRGTITTNPTNQMVFHVFSTDASTALGSFTYLLFIEYECVFTELKTIGSS